MEDTWRIYITFNVLQTGFVMYSIGKVIVVMLRQLFYRVTHNICMHQGSLLVKADTDGLRWTNPDVGKSNDAENDKDCLNLC